MRWIAELSWRLPYFGLRIVPAVLPDQCGRGATPACCAKAASFEKRVTSAVSPMIFAAVTAPQPGIAVEVRGHLTHSVGDSLLQRVDVGGQPRDVGELVEC